MKPASHPFSVLQACIENGMRPTRPSPPTTHVAAASFLCTYYNTRLHPQHNRGDLLSCLRVQDLRGQLCSLGAAGAPLLLQAYIAGGEAARVAQMVDNLYCEDGRDEALMEAYHPLAGLIVEQSPTTAARCASRLLLGEIVQGRSTAVDRMHAGCSVLFTTSTTCSLHAMQHCQQLCRCSRCVAVTSSRTASSCRHRAPTCISILAGENGWAACITLAVTQPGSNDTVLLDTEQWATPGTVVLRPMATNGTAGDGVLAPGRYDISWQLVGTGGRLCEAWNASSSSWDYDPSSPAVDQSLYNIAPPPRATYQAS